MVIFLKTYSYDKEYLFHCLKSIKKFVTGYEYICIVSDDNFDFDRQGLKIDFIVEKQRYNKIGYENQQITKLYAFNYVPVEVDKIFFIDSDTIFTDYTDLSLLPIQWFYREWIELGNDPHCCWRPTIELLFGKDKTVDAMAGPGNIYTRHLFNCLQVWLLKKGLTFKTLYEKYKVVSEFQLIGNYIYHTDFEEYNLLHASKYNYKVKQFWSHDKIIKNKAEIEKYLN